ncbi:MAG: aminodeoxychorismate synthase component I [Gammaproteobacteria bacterium]|nr:MAG: aminodeoxychorismate synthase component I [Gammaproteobacteria bacterium]
MKNSSSADCGWRRLPVRSDLLAVHRAHPERYPFLLESVERGGERARFDLLFAFPGGRLTLRPGGELCSDSVNLTDGDFLAHLDKWMAQTGTPVASPPPLPFFGGWFVYLGYELVTQTEPSVLLPVNRGQHAVAEAHRIPAAIIRDHLSGDTVLVAESEHLHCLEQMEQDLRLAVSGDGLPGPPAPGLPVQLEEDPPDQFLDGVERIKRYIRDGDVFQVNLSRGWRGQLADGVDPAAVYARLRAANPAPFAGLAVFGERAVASSSPERLVNVTGDTVQTRPIAGTYPRNPDRNQDRALSEALLAHPKERAEHIMLIDLERNDLGRVCRTGSIEVNELMVLESYTHVHHIVSNVRGRLRAEVTPAQVIRAVFPGGTITGCPKVRCMQIIAELEGRTRGPYTGAFAYFNRDGSGDSNILIRTISLEGEKVEVRAGAGIVADSRPTRELDETRQKARGPLSALTGLLE